MDDAAAPPAPPAAPAPPTAPNAPATPAPDAPLASVPDAPAAPDPAWERSRRLRLQAKVAGVMMMLFGVFFAINLGLAAYNTPKLPETYAGYPGGNVTVTFPQAPGANVTLTYRSGVPATHGTLDAAGNGTFHATNATFTLQVMHGGATWTRKAFVLEGTPAQLATVALAPDAPRDSSTQVGLPTDFPWLWPAAIGALLVTIAGYFAFKLRGPRVAMGGAFLFLAGAGLLLATFPVQLLTLSFVATAGLCFAFVYRARAEFSPMLVRPAAA